VFAVTAGVQLAGLTPDEFAQEGVTNAFLATASSSMGVSPSSVAITGVAAVSSAAATGRRMLQAALQVDYQVYLLTAAAATGVASRISASGGPSLAALQAAGVPTTGVVLTTLPDVVAIPAPPTPPSPAPPPPAPPPPAGCGSSWFCFAGVACASASTCGACPAGTAGDGVACSACSLSVAITPSFGGNASASAADATLAGVVSAAETSCNVTGGFIFAWSATTAIAAAGGPLLLAAAPVRGAAGPALTLPARSLLGNGQQAAFVLQACVARASSPTCSNASFSFAVTASPLVALMGGGGGVIGESPFTLSGAASFDPDGAGGAVLSYAWTCARLDGSSPACAARDGTPVIAAANVAGAATLRAQLAGAAAPGALYLFTLTVSEGGRSSSVNTTVTVLPGALPFVSVAGSAVLSGAKADPSRQLVLFANVTAFVPGAVATRWAVVEQRGVSGALLNLSDPAVSATAVTSVSMVIRPGALAPGASYVFQLTATDAVGAVGSANTSIRTSSPARDGWADVAPSSGVALSTQFLLTAAGWSADADELPLTYAIDYFIDGSPAPPVSLTGGAFQAAPAITVQLPAGLEVADNVVTLRLTVRSAFGATVSANASVVVAWPTFENAAAATAFVDGGTARAAAALQTGDASSALQVVGGLAALLNSEAAGGTDAAAAATQRAELLTIVADAFNQSAGASMGAAAVKSTAALVSSLVSSPAQLSGAGALAALSVLGSVASAGAAVSPAAAQSVAAALSSMALAPSGAGTAAAAGGSGGGASSNNNFVAVLSVLDSLSLSQASAMSVPGQAAATVSTPAIQMSVALCSVDAGSPLFSAPLSAPGSKSSFDPLPLGTLDAAGGASVSSTFLSLTFDAHSSSAGGAPSNNTGGMTRLAFSVDGGTPLPVDDLTAPLLFTLPVSLLAPGQRAACAWWDDDDATAAAYSTDGCASLPSPAPPGHNLTFVSGFVASGHASLAMAWTISGPLMDGCTPAFLDCTNATQRLNGKLQVGAAAVSCGNASDIILRAYLGAECALADTANASMCTWDVTTQAFAGAACVAANATRCMCTHLTDFTSSQEVNIPVCSLSDLVGLNPADIGARLVLLALRCLHALRA
jgi:hypothetical protein